MFLFPTPDVSLMPKGDMEKTFSEREIVLNGILNKRFCYFYPWIP